MDATTSPAASITTTRKLAMFVTLGSGRRARVWVPAGTLVQVEMAGTFWTITLPGGRKGLVVPRIFMEATG